MRFIVCSVGACRQACACVLCCHARVHVWPCSVLPCSNSDGPENVFDGQLAGASGSTWARTEPPTWPGLVDYVAMQLTLDREYSDIYAFDYYLESTQVAYGKNISIYLSPTTSFLNGSVCAANLTLTSVGATPNRINCTNTIANARYVTVVKYTFAGSDYLHCNELQILRSGGRGDKRRAACARPTLPTNGVPSFKNVHALPTHGSNGLV